MRKILMFLTNARRDCAAIALELLEQGGGLDVFDHVVFLLNGVSVEHLRFVDAFIARHPEVACDKVLGPGTRPEGISWMQNECIRRYPDSLYMKIDEDVFVPRGWAARMVEAYEANRSRDNLALITPLLPNNAFGLHQLCTLFYPDLLAEHRRLFNRDPEPERASFTWQSPAVAEWATRRFLRVNDANEAHRAVLQASGLPRYEAFTRPFSIGCIAYDYRHVQRMGGVPKTDEPGWCDWVEKNGQVHVVDRSQIVLHYSFFVQQEWLDRSSLIEDLRVANLPGTQNKLAGTLARAGRITRQIPGILRRRLLKKP